MDSSSLTCGRFSQVGVVYDDQVDARLFNANGEPAKWGDLEVKRCKSCLASSIGLLELDD